MIMRSMMFATTLALFSLGMGTAAEDPIKHLATIKAVGGEGSGNAEAAAAWKALAASGIDALIPTLTAMNDAKPVAANWLRLAAQAIVEKELQAKRPLPVDKLQAFVENYKQAPISRRAAYEFLVQADPKAPERLLPSMIEDPSVDLRRDAIAAALEAAKPKPDKATLEKLFAASRDQDQTEQIAKMLKELKAEPDLNKHIGAVSSWMLIGPFDSKDGTGFDKAYEPETKIDLAATYTGKDGKEVKWIAHTSPEPYSLVDLNKALGKHKDAVAYAFTTIEAEQEMPVEIRFGCICAIKVFLNGKQVFGREEYHHGQRFDQYVGIGTLKKGRNELLLKVCQNNQTENWAQDWKFQMRLCDFTGGALPVKVVTAR